MSLSIIILIKNNQDQIRDCLKTVLWADEVMLVDTGSTDNTIKIAKKMVSDVRVIKTEGGSFDAWRNLGRKSAKGEWVFYVDSDERVTKKLKKEIQSLIINHQSSAIAFRIPRKNYYFGRRVKYGGSWPDYVTRLFKKDKLIKWTGIIHESPKFKGKLGTFKNPLIHKTHKSMSKCLKKSIEWTKKEAELFYKAGHPRVTWWRVLKVGTCEFLKRAVFLQGFRDGTVGIVEALVQSYNRMMVYIYLWEMQYENRNV